MTQNALKICDPDLTGENYDFREDLKKYIKKGSLGIDAELRSFLDYFKENLKEPIDRIKR